MFAETEHNIEKELKHLVDNDKGIIRRWLTMTFGADECPNETEAHVTMEGASHGSPGSGADGGWGVWQRLATVRSRS